MAQDFLGNVLEVGDTVVFTQLGYRNFSKGVLLKLTPKTLIVACAITHREVKQFHDQVIKLPVKS
jgi:hypothetical protein